MFKLFFTLLLFITYPVFADDEPLHGGAQLSEPFNFKSPDDNEPYQAAEHIETQVGCGGYARVGFIETNQDSAFAVGGELGCGYRFNEYFKVHLGLFGSLDPGLNSQTDDNIQDDFFNDKKDSYLIVGEAVLTVEFENFDAHLGRQRFDSPHMDADDLRMVPNLFEAYLLDYNFSDELKGGAGFVREAAGWENGANISQFVSVGEAFGGEDSGAWVSWLTYQQQQLTSDTWFYYIPDHLTILYTELNYSDQITDSVSYSFGLQYDWGSDTGNAKISHVDAHTVGVMLSFSWLDLTFTSAYNKNFGDTGSIASIGGGPYFTSVEELTMDAVEGVDTQSVLLNVELELIDDLVVGAAVAKFEASNRADFNQEELNLYSQYSWKEKITAELMYAVVDDRNSGPDLHQIRAILTYQF